MAIRFLFVSSPLPRWAFGRGAPGPRRIGTPFPSAEITNTSPSSSRAGIGRASRNDPTATAIRRSATAPSGSSTWVPHIPGPLELQEPSERLSPEFQDPAPDPPLDLRATRVGRVADVPEPLVGEGGQGRSIAGLDVVCDHEPGLPGSGNVRVW
ncbi:MAG TPA: hypothetical protein VH092_37310 [Urbifossiella sp.]|jgi:hypothetical protein|nr:hypothetical protein [Urbifossiella sp.]